MDAATLERVAAEERPRLLGLAYRMTGSRSDAEDVVQDALLRAHRAAPADITTPAAYLTTITTRVAIDYLRSARVRRESYVGPWLPEPIAADPAPDAAARAVVDDNLSMAFLMVLEALTPEERAVLVLHDVFAYSHAEIATILDRSEVSCRQILRRARLDIQARRQRTEVDPSRREEVVRSFIAACQEGEIEPFVRLLADDAVLIFDGGPDIKTAARRPIQGADRVGRFLTNVMTRLTEGRRALPATLNGGPAVLVYSPTNELIGAIFIEPGRDGSASLIRWIRNPAKLRGLI